MEASTAPLAMRLLEPWWRNICVGRNKTQHGETKPAENEYQNGDNDTENEFSHQSLRTHYCGR
jgi:hypothetical protein